MPSARQARLMSLGFSTLAADVYWVQSLQYFMDPGHALDNYKNLADYLDLVVGIDPDFNYAYRFAAVAVPYDAGRMHWKNTRRATALLERGVERFPEDWQLHFYLGYHYLNFHDEPAKAAEQFALAARLPGAPAYLNAFAARVYTLGGALERAISFAEEVLNASTDPEIVAMMRERLEDLREEQQLRRIEEAIAKYREAHGRAPATVGELVGAGALSEAPPKGFWIGTDGRAHGPRSERMVLHVNLASDAFTVED